jgi:hypothetical protein
MTTGITGNIPSLEMSDELVHTAKEHRGSGPEGSVLCSRYCICIYAMMDDDLHQLSSSYRLLGEGFFGLVLTPSSQVESFQPGSSEAPLS